MVSKKSKVMGLILATKSIHFRSEFFNNRSRSFIEYLMLDAVWDRKQSVKNQLLCFRMISKHN